MYRAKIKNINQKFKNKSAVSWLNRPLTTLRKSIRLCNKLIMESKANERYI